MRRGGGGGGGGGGALLHGETAGIMGMRYLSGPTCQEHEYVDVLAASGLVGRDGPSAYPPLQPPQGQVGWKRMHSSAERVLQFCSQLDSASHVCSLGGRRPAALPIQELKV